MYRFQIMCRVVQVAIIIISVVVKILGNWESSVYFLLMALIIGQSALLANDTLRGDD